jgi:alcohol dehydrogenase class IV
LESTKVGVLDGLFGNVGGLPEFMKTLGVPADLAVYGVKEGELDLWVEQTLRKGDVKITPGPVDAGVIAAIYRRALSPDVR